MIIVIHREYSTDDKADSRYLYGQLRVNFPDKVIKYEHYGSRIEIRNITILFYSGDIRKLDGLRPHYYNCDTSSACDYCKMSVRKLVEYDPELRTFSDVIDIIREEIEKDD